MCTVMILALGMTWLAFNTSAVHMDTVNHTAVSRADMRKFIRGQGIESRVNVPEDGEIVKLD